MLRKEGVYNDLSPALAEELEKQIIGFGKSVRFSFDISHADPDPEKANTNSRLWPFMWTLKPVTFSIDDKQETRKEVQKFKKVGMVEETEEVNGRLVAKRFKRVKVLSKDKGIKKYDLTNNEDVEQVMYLLLHPSLTGGKFSDPALKQSIKRIDEMAAATTARTERSDRLKALNAAQGMSDRELTDFCDAMGIDSTQEVEVLRNEVEALADNNPVFFNDLVQGKAIEYQSVVKQAMNKGLISFDPGEYKFVYTGNKQTITVLTPTGTKNEVEKMGEWLAVGGKKSDEVYKKLKALLTETN